MSSEPRLRVLQVTPRFHPSVGGVETHVREVAQRLDRHGIASSVLTVDETGGLPGEEEVDGISVRRVAGYPRGRDWMFAPSLPDAIRAARCDLVHIQSYHTLVAPLAMMTCARTRTPYVLTFHGGGSSSGLRSAARATQLRLLAPWLRRARALVAIADFEIEDYGPLIGVPRSRFVKIPNGADLPADVDPIPSEGPLLVSVGRLEAYKGHARVISAFPDIVRAIPDARLWVAGSGPDEEALRAQAARLGVQDRVEVGGAERSVLAGRLQGAAAMVLLSDFESHPLAVLEAASLGVPAVVADNSGLAELAARGLATAVPTSADAEIHARAIVAAMLGPRPEPRSDIPSWDDCAAQLAALYRSAVGGGS